MKGNNNIYPFANEVKEMKDHFKKMIDSMSDADFLDFIDMINTLSDSYDDNYDDDFFADDEGWEDEAAKFYGYNPDDIEDDDSIPF